MSFKIGFLRVVPAYRSFFATLTVVLPKYIEDVTQSYDLQNLKHKLQQN